MARPRRPTRRPRRRIQTRRIKGAVMKDEIFKITPTVAGLVLHYLTPISAAFTPPMTVLHPCRLSPQSHLVARISHDSAHRYIVSRQQLTLLDRLRSVFFPIFQIVGNLDPISSSLTVYNSWCVWSQLLYRERCIR